MQLHVPSIAFISGAITATIAMAALFYSLAHKENRPFLWVAAAVSGFAAAMYLSGFRGQLSDFYSIVLANELGIFTLVAFFEGYRRLLGVRPWERFVGPLVLILQPVFFIWFTYYEPSFRNRLIVINCSVVIMALCFLKLLWATSSKKGWLFHLFAALPFASSALLNSDRVFQLLVRPEAPVDSLSSPDLAYRIMSFGIMATWMSLSIFFIVTDRLQTHVREMSLTDPLTGLLNRRALRDVAQREVARAQRTGSPLALIISDLDHFKAVNDKYGHQAGDAVLAHSARLFKIILRQEDVLARYGGEEFVALLPGTTLPEAMMVADRMRQACKDSVIKAGSHDISLTCSFGVCAQLSAATGYDELLKLADQALYLAKEGGRDRVEAMPDGDGAESSA